MIGFVLSETFRDVRRAGRVGVSAVVMIGFSFFGDSIRDALDPRGA